MNSFNQKHSKNISPSECEALVLSRNRTFWIAELFNSDICVSYSLTAVIKPPQTKTTYGRKVGFWSQ